MGAARQARGAASFIVVSGAGALDTAREGQVRVALEAAQKALAEAGLWAAEVEPVVVVLDVSQPSRALTLADAGTTHGPYSGRPAVLLSRGAELDSDVLLHELTHVWMRARGPRDEHGAGEARWRLDGALASHQGAMVQEGVADFVAAALTRDPMLGERSVGAHLAQSVSATARCPDDLVGQPHRDALVVSGALWDLASSDEATGLAEVVAAVAASAPRAAIDVEVFVAGLGLALEGRAPALARRWTEIADERGLSRCAEPIAVETRVTSRIDDFVAVGTRRVDGVNGEVMGPLTFRAALAGEGGVTIVVRSGRQSPPLEVQWRTEGGWGDVEGRAPLEGWPSQYAHLSVPTGPASGDTLVFGFVNTAPDDVAFNDVGIERTAHTHTEPTNTHTKHVIPNAAAPSDWGWFAVGGCGVALALGWVLWRRRAGLSRPSRVAQKAFRAKDEPGE